MDSTAKPDPQYTPSPEFAALREIHRLRFAAKDLTDRDLWLLVLDKLQALLTDKP